jgi:oxygen-independent coproporphyrinogen-3 oxidase
MAEIGLYIHVPFCLRRCAYCDFNTYAGLLPLRPAYVAALEQEAALWAEQHPGLKAITLYFGGGTPSLLKPEQVARLIAAARALFALPPDAEVTLEANPGTVTEASLYALRAAGVNRLSLGVHRTMMRNSAPGTRPHLGAVRGGGCRCTPGRVR